MAASGEKRARRKPLAAPSATIPGIDTGSTDSTPPLPGLPGAVVPARAARRTVTKAPPAAPAVPAIETVPFVAPAPVAAIEEAPLAAAEQAEQAVDAVAQNTASVAEEAAETASDVTQVATDTLVEATQDTADAAATAVAEVPALADEASHTTRNAARAAFTQQEKTIMDTVQNTAEKTQAFFADANERTKGAVEKSAKFFQEMTEFGKGNVEAVVESSKIAARGFETMGQDTAAYLKTSFEEASQALRTLATIKSPTELMKFQADYLRSSFDAMVAQTSRGAEASLKLAGEVAQPISNRVAVAAEKLKVNA